MKSYVTFGQAHAHAINGQVFDKDCVAVIEHEKDYQGREKAFELFGQKWGWIYSEENFNNDVMKFYPRGFIEV